MHLRLVEKVIITSKGTYLYEQQYSTVSNFGSTANDDQLKIRLRI